MSLILSKNLEWFETYFTLQKNLIQPTSNHKGCAFGTDGPELAYVESVVKSSPRHVWSVNSTDEGWILQTGLHPVNALYYLVANEPYSIYHEFVIDFD